MITEWRIRGTICNTTVKDRGPILEAMTMKRAYTKCEEAKFGSLRNDENDSRRVNCWERSQTDLKQTVR